MTPEQLTKLKDGDIIRQLSSGNAYTVLRNTGPVVIAARTLEVTNASEWEHLYTTTPVKEQVPPSQPALSVTEIVTKLEKLGWTFDVDKNEWTSPDRTVNLRNLKYAWKHRHDFRKPKLTPYPPYVPSFIPIFWVRKKELENAGWKNPYGYCPNLPVKLQNIWISPEWVSYGDSTAAWTEMTRQRIEKLGGNPS